MNQHECEIRAVYTCTIRHITLIFECTYKSICIIIICGIWTLGRILFNYKKHLCCYQKDRTSSRSVSMHSYLSYDASPAHKIGCCDKF